MARLPAKPVRERSGKTSRDEQKERTRERIYEAARELFLEKGYLQTRTVDIANRAGVSQGAVHAHFQTKADILSALMVDYLEKVDQEMDLLELSGADSIQDLKTAVLKVIRLHIENMDQVSWYYGYAWIWGEGDEKNYQRLMDRVRERFYKILRDGVARGQIHPDTPVEIIVDLIRGYYRGYLRRLRYGGVQWEPFSEQLDRCLSVLLDQYKMQAR